jgi:DNA replication licensing factor MCM6
MLKPGEKFQMSANLEGNRTNSFNQGVSGLRSTGVQDLNYKMVFVANNVLHTESRFGTTINIREDVEENIQDTMTQAEKDEIRSMKEMPGLYSMMARSICPMIYGNEEIKKGILLMLFGGIHKTTAEGIKLRGDLNICIVGDPSTAKSQFLKYIHGFLPRCVYTSGKASSAAGLTASVQRDPETGEFTIEAGALMLADNGICCCDEFDKMEEKDQVAIHEAMEQQTISITKAGIQATLNARTSILAAANPIMGRYDKNKSLKNNINISAPLMSRFDLFYVVCDQSDEQTDVAIARHILQTHQNIDQNIDAPFTMQSLQRSFEF